MFTRIVKMHFRKEEIPAFLDNFETVKHKIRNFEGCLFLELYCDKNIPEIYFTYSRWNDSKDLENYRNSALFKEVWNITKTMFAEKAEAWSVDTLISIQ